MFKAIILIDGVFIAGTSAPSFADMKQTINLKLFNFVQLH